MRLNGVWGLAVAVERRERTRRGMTTSTRERLVDEVAGVDRARGAVARGVVGGMARSGASLILSVTAALGGLSGWAGSVVGSATSAAAVDDSVRAGAWTGADDSAGVVVSVLDVRLWFICGSTVSQPACSLQHRAQLSSVQLFPDNPPSENTEVRRGDYTVSILRIVTLSRAPDEEVESTQIADHFLAFLGIGIARTHHEEARQHMRAASRTYHCS